MTARRIRLRRIKGWRKPEGAVVVSRPSMWGNLYHVRPGIHGGWAVEDDLDHFGILESRAGAHTYATQLFRDALIADQDVRMLDCIIGYSVDDVRRELAGRDLCCWCPLDLDCHADVLLELANQPTGSKSGWLW